MSTYAQVMHDRRNEAIGTLRHLLDTAASESRDLTPEELEQADRIEADIKRFAKESERAQRVQALQVAADELRGVREPVTEGSVPERREFTDREQLTRAVAARYGEFESPMDTRIAQSWEPSEVRALQSAGGSALGTTFSGQVIVYARNLTPMLRPDLFTVIASNGPMGPLTFTRWTADQSAGSTAIAEAGGITEADPTLSTFQLDGYKFGVTTLLSNELATDAEFDIEGYVARGAARELSYNIGAALTTGNGSTFPNGIVNAAANGGTASGTASNTSLDTFFGPKDLIDLKFTRNLDYIQRGSYMVSVTAAAKMRAFRDSNKQFLYQPSLVAGMPDQFDGTPVVINPAMAAVASASKSVLFGDLSAYFVRVGPMRVDVSRDYKFNTDQLAIRTLWRVDGDLSDLNAVAYLVSANT